MPTADPAPQKCICQICTCGRHRCPHRPGTTFQFGSNGQNGNPLVTEYNERYKDKDFAKREPLRRARDNLGFATDRMEDATTSRADFVPQKLERTQVFRNLDNLRPEGQMDMGTIYKNEFDAKQGQRGTPRATRKDNLGTSSAKFEAMPSYREDYKTWSVGRPERIRRPDGITYSEEPFDAYTTQRASYGGQQGQKASANRPRTMTKLEGPFDGTTTLSQDYVPWGVTSRPEKRKPEDFIKSTGDHDMNTTNQLDYKDNRTERTRANRPQTATKVGGDFDGATTNRDAYKGMQGERQKSFKPEALRQSSEPFDGYTTSRSDYTEKIGARAKTQRPQTATKIDGDFSKETTNTADYQPWKTQKPELRRAGEYVRPEAAMDMNTIMRTDYGDQKGERSKLTRPPTSQRYTGDQDNQTTHKQDYTGWITNRPTPVAKVEYKPPSGKFEGQTTNKLDFVHHRDGLGSCLAEGLIGHGGGNEHFRFRTEVGGHHFYMPALPLR